METPSSSWISFNASFHWSGVGWGWTRYRLDAAVPHQRVRHRLVRLQHRLLDDGVRAVAPGIQHERAVRLALLVHPVRELEGELVLRAERERGVVEAVLALRVGEPLVGVDDRLVDVDVLEG